MRRFVWIWCLLLVLTPAVQGQSWEQALEKKQAQLDLHWFTSLPFIYRDGSEAIAGIEYEILESFQAFCAKNYGVEVTLNWIEAESFQSILDINATSSSPNQLGVSAFSITESRQKVLKFTDSYMPDITVLVSSKGTPIVQTFDEINKMMRNMEAVTIQGTIYENLLIDLKKQLNIEFEMIYIHSDQNVLQAISKAQNRFGFIDLPIYLMLIKSGGDLTRQNFFTVRGAGYGYIMPQSSDWNEPFNEFLLEASTSGEIANIITKYIGPELYEFYENIYGGGQLGTTILTKEKEIQLELIKNANLRLEQERAHSRIFIVAIVVTVVFLIVIGMLFVNNQKVTRQIQVQKDRIESQAEDIRLKNEQLENRNEQLVALNEEKNNLMRILAHDLRSPISQIVMVAEVLGLSKANLTDEDRRLLGLINDGAMRINQMITKILDVEALEGNKSRVLMERVAICDLMDEITERYRPIVTEKGISLDKDPCEAGLEVETDHMLLFQVIENLLSNAVKFSPMKSTVSLKVVIKDSRVHILVADQGPGFTAEDKQKMFLRFQKLSAQPTGDETSIGLGLSIVKKYVTELGGELLLETEIGKGSTFTVVLPLAQA